jgi:hypothetical protein
MLGDAKDLNDKSKKQKAENDQKQATVTKGNKKKADTVVFDIHEIALAGKASLLEYDILCDNQTTINIFRNKYAKENQEY